MANVSCNTTTAPVISGSNSDEAVGVGNLGRRRAPHSVLSPGLTILDGAVLFSSVTKAFHLYADKFCLHCNGLSFFI